MDHTKRKKGTKGDNKKMVKPQCSYTVEEVGEKGSRRERGEIEQ